MRKKAMGAGDKRFQNENMGAKTAAGSTRLYHIMSKIAMGAGDKRFQNENMGAKTAARQPAQAI